MFFKDYCATGTIEQVKRALNSHVPLLLGLESAIEKNRVEIVEQIVAAKPKLVNWNTVLCLSCKLGNMFFSQIAIKKGAADWADALTAAANHANGNFIEEFRQIIFEKN